LHLFQYFQRFPRRRPFDEKRVRYWRWRSRVGLGWRRGKGGGVLEHTEDRLVGLVLQRAEHGLVGRRERDLEPLTAMGATELGAGLALLGSQRLFASGAEIADHGNTPPLVTSEHFTAAISSTG